MNRRRYLRAFPFALVALAVLAGVTFGWDSTAAQIAPVQPGSPADQEATGTITTDAASHVVGELMEICYDVPGPGPITITALRPDGTTEVLVSGEDDGTGGCIEDVVTPPVGRECLRLEYTTAAGSGSAETCFDVAEVEVVPPGAWARAGSLPVTDDTWTFDAEVMAGPDASIVHVTSGACGDDPHAVIVFEARLVRADVERLGVDVLVGSLEPVGEPADATHGSGSARLIRAVDPGAEAHIDATLFHLADVPRGTIFTVCVR